MVTDHEEGRCADLHTDADRRSSWWVQASSREETDGEQAACAAVLVITSHAGPTMV
jgi:hypothetical protein